MIKFGDVFRYNEQQFVFLGQTEEVTYAAKILEDKMAQVIRSRYEKMDTHNSPKVNNALYSFVILKTPPFQEKMAHFTKTDQNGKEMNFDILATLNLSDLKEIKSEIISSAAVPTRLKELMKDIIIV